MKQAAPSTRRMVLWLGLFAVLGCNGCGSFINLSQGLYVYGGVSTDLEYAADPPLPQDEVGWWWSFDLPFSALLDTVLLPVHLMAQGFQAFEPTITGTQPLEDRVSGQDGQARAGDAKGRSAIRSGQTNPTRPEPVRIKPRRDRGGTTPL